jgi:ABC-type multidrug transport system ATPase subunit
MSGFVEQTDINPPRATVKEAIMFAAQLRMGSDVSDT